MHSIACVPRTARRMRSANRKTSSVSTISSTMTPSSSPPRLAVASDLQRQPTGRRYITPNALREGLGFCLASSGGVSTVLTRPYQIGLRAVPAPGAQIYGMDMGWTGLVRGEKKGPPEPLAGVGDVR